MPAVSRKQAIAMRIAEHDPGKLYARNRGLAKMPKAQLQEFTHTPTAGLPIKKRSNATMRRFR